MNSLNLILDNKADAYTLLFRCLDAFDEILKEADGTNDCETVYESMHDLAKNLIKAEPNKVLIRRVTTNLLNHCKRILNSEKSSGEIVQSINDRLANVREELEKNAQKISAMASRAIAHTNKILTASYDYLVLRTLQEAEKQKRRFEVYVVKSDPPAEGLDFAEKLAEMGIRTTVIADSQVGVFLPEMNLVFLSPERLYERGFIHRAGSLPLCLTAHHFNIPVYLLAETKTILFERERSVKYHEKEPAEVYTPKNANIQVLNYYHTSIPFHLIYKLICEDGIFEMNEFINWYLAE